MIGNMRRFVWSTGLVILLVSAFQTRIEAQICPEGSFSAKYYKNQTLTGTPAFTRCEKRIDFDWGSQGPKGTVATRGGSRASSGDAGGIEDQEGKVDGPTTAVSIGVDHFSAKWRGNFQFPAGDYTFIAKADDGIRVWVDGQKIIDAWRDQGPTEYRANRNLTAGPHTIEVFYYENDNGATVRLRWQRQ